MLTIFLFQHLKKKTVLRSSNLHSFWFSDEKSAVNFNLCSSIYNVLFISGCFQDFILFKLVEFVNLFPSQICKVISHNSFKYFLYQSHSPLLWYSDDINARPSDIVQQFSEALFTFFQIFFSLYYSDWIISIALHLKFIFVC